MKHCTDKGAVRKIRVCDIIGPVDSGRHAGRRHILGSLFPHINSNHVILGGLEVHNHP